jgi:hypothetical protein
VVRDLKLSYAAVKGIMENAGFEPSGSETCELEVGQRIARAESWEAGRLFLQGDGDG